MTRLRTGGYVKIDGMQISCMKDYGEGVSTDIATAEKEVINLPSSNVIGFHLADGSSVIVRPSGTEPKIKFYMEAKGEMGCAKCYASAGAAADAKFEAIKKSLGI